LPKMSTQMLEAGVFYVGTNNDSIAALERACDDCMTKSKSQAKWDANAGGPTMELPTGNVSYVFPQQDARLSSNPSQKGTALGGGSEGWEEKWYDINQSLVRGEIKFKYDSNGESAAYEISDPRGDSEYPPEVMELLERLASQD